MAAGRHRDHRPVSIELGRNCGRSRTDDCESGRQSEGAHTIANQGILLRVLRKHTGEKALSNRHSLADGVEPSLLRALTNCD
jgi:hypothetical protein